MVSGTVRPDGTTTADGYMINLSLFMRPIGDSVMPCVAPSPYNLTEGMLLKGGRIFKTDDLAPGTSKKYTASVELPRNLRPGRY